MSYFKFFIELHNFMLFSVNINNTQSLVGVCVCLALFTLCIEGFKVLQVVLSTDAAKNPLEYGQTERNLSEHSELLTPMLIPSSVKSVQRRRCNYYLIQSIVHMLQVVVGYLVMLAVMTYNAWIIITVALSSGIGYYIFGAVRDQIYQAETEAHYRKTLRQCSYQTIT